MLIVILQGVLGAEKPYIIGRVWGQLGNQLFIIAATTSLALDHDASAIFPDYVSAFDPAAVLHCNHHRASLCTNYREMLNHLNVCQPAHTIAFRYQEPSFTYTPIDYHPNMCLEGWFQSEKYFARHKETIVNLFAPPDRILAYLNKTYGQILQHPMTVSVHMRYYAREDPEGKIYLTYGRDYIEKAMACFPSDALFVVFSDNMEWCQQELASLERNILFIEGEKYYHDFYLMSLCKHNIICNSTFSWWAAYLNTNINKRVIAPPRWFAGYYNEQAGDIIPDSWVILQDDRSLDKNASYREHTVCRHRDIESP